MNDTGLPPGTRLLDRRCRWRGTSVRLDVVCFVACLVAACALALRLAAQVPDDGRGVLVGSAVGLDGKPWGRARVLLFSPAIDAFHVPWLVAPRAPDSIEVDCDDAGRFRARVLRERAYQLVAVSAGAPPRVSDVASAGQATRGLRLVEARTQPVRKRVAVVGLEAWRDVGPLSVSYYDGLGRSTVLPANAETHEMPPPVSAYGSVQVQAGERLIAAHGLMLDPASSPDPTWLASDRERNAKEAPLPGLPDLTAIDAPADVEHVVVGPPVRVRVRVIDGATRQPIVGATVGYYDLGVHHVTADTDGRCETIVPFFVNRWGRGEFVRLLARAPGYAARGFGWTREPRLDFERPLREALDGEVDIELPLAKGLVLRGQVRGTETVTPSQVGIHWMAFVPHETKGTTSGGMGFPEWARPDQHGSWTLPGFAQPQALVLTFVLSGQSMARLAPDGRFPQPMAAFDRWLLPSVARTGGVLGGGVFDLAALRFVDLELVLQGGEPAADAQVSWRPGAREHTGLEVSHARCDRRGRTRIAIDGPVILVAQLPEHFAVVELTADERLIARRLELRPMATAKGRVVDLDGRPVAGAQVFLRSRRVEDGDGNAVVAQHTGRANEMRLRTTTNASGEFSVRFLTAPRLRLQLGASKQVGRDHASCEESGTWLGEESADGVEIVLSSRQGK